MVRYILISVFMILSNLIYASNIENTYINTKNDDFNNKVTELLLSKLNLQNSNANLNIELNTQNVSSIESDTIDTIEITYFSNKNYNFNLQVIMKTGKQFLLRGKYNGTVETPVTAQYIKFGELLTTNNIALQHIPLHKILGTHYLINPDNVIGMQARRNLPRDIALKAKDLAKPIIVRPKDKVTITYFSDNLEIKTSAIAMDKGSIGDKIKVKNEKTGIIVYCTIFDKDTILAIK